MKIGYARVSSQGQNLDRQFQRLRDEGCQKIYSEKHSGARRKRPQLDTVLAALKPNDTLIVTGLSRLTRSGAGDMINILTELTARGVKFHSLDEPWANTEDHMGEFMVTVFAGMYQLFRRLQLEAAEDGRATARADTARSRPLGGPKPKVTAAHKAEIRRLASEGHGNAAIARAMNDPSHGFSISRMTVWRVLNE
jgi:DNA invertase Pin-like site-specific DNA recombinase